MDILNAMKNDLADVWTFVALLFCSDEGLTRDTPAKTSRRLAYPHQLSVDTIHYFTIAQ